MGKANHSSLSTLITGVELKSFVDVDGISDLLLLSIFSGLKSMRRKEESEAEDRNGRH